MTWYKTGTATVTNGSPTVTLAGANAQLNIFPDDGFVGPDGRLYAVLSVASATTFTLSTNYSGPTASAQPYLAVPVADHVQLRDLLISVNTLVGDYQTIANEAGAGRFPNGSAASPGVKGISNAGTGLVWTSNALSVSVNGTIVATFNANGSTSVITFPDGTVGTPGIRFTADTNTGIYRTADDTISFATNGVERVTMGNDLPLTVGQSSNNLQALFGRTVNGTSPIIRFQGRSSTGTNRYGDIQLDAEIPTLSIFAPSAGVPSNKALNINVSSHVYPGDDNLRNLGLPAHRWSTVYAGTGTINTSDQNEKTTLRSFTSAELNASRRIAKIIGIFQWLASVAEKGEDNARHHVGVVAQDVWGIMADEGLIDPLVEGETPSTKYGFLCYDEWEEETGETTVTKEAGSRFGIRPDQLALFLIAAQEARLTALEESL